MKAGLKTLTAVFFLAHQIEGGSECTNRSGKHRSTKVYPTLEARIDQPNFHSQIPLRCFILLLSRCIASTDRFGYTTHQKATTVSSWWISADFRHATHPPATIVGLRWISSKV